MSEVHLEEHSSLIKTPQQLIVVIVLAFLIPVVGIVMLASYITGGLKVDPKSSDASATAVAERLKPVGTVVIGEVPPTAAATPAAGARPAAASSGVTSTSGEAVKTAAASGPAAGKKLYDTVCVACHGAGIAGAPKTGDKAAWKPRVATGKDALYNSALHGKNAMPAKGGLTSASDGDVKAAVDYLIGLAK
jgi:cytochrome c5